MLIEFVIIKKNRWNAVQEFLTGLGIFLLSPVASCWENRKKSSSVFLPPSGAPEPGIQRQQKSKKQNKKILKTVVMFLKDLEPECLLSTWEASGGEEWLNCIMRSLHQLSNTPLFCLTVAQHYSTNPIKGFGDEICTLKKRRSKPRKDQRFLNIL